MTRTRMFGAAFVAGIVILAAGCGGDDSETSASTQWADGVCSALTTWQDDIVSTASTLKDNPSRDGFEEAANEAKSSTETLVDTVKGLGAPDTESGDQAKATIDTLTTELQSDVDTISSAVSDASGVQGLLDAVSTVTATVSKMTSQLTSSLDDLSSLGEVDDELRQSFDDASSCDGLIPGGS